MQGDGAIATGCVHSRINWRAFMAEVFDELESQQIVVETERSGYILNVDRGMVESKFVSRILIGGRPSPCLLSLFDSHPLCEPRISSLFAETFLAAGFFIESSVGVFDQPGKYCRANRNCQPRLSTPIKRDHRKVLATFLSCEPDFRLKHPQKIRVLYYCLASDDVKGYQLPASC